MDVSELKIHGCLTPKVLPHPYKDGETMVVPCNSCMYCRQVRASNMMQRIDREFRSNKGIELFVTLDYDNAHLPIYSRVPRVLEEDFEGLFSYDVDDGYEWKSNRSTEAYDAVFTADELKESDVSSLNPLLVPIARKLISKKQEVEDNRLKWKSYGMRKADREAKAEAKRIYMDSKRECREFEKSYNKMVRSSRGYRKYLEGRFDPISDEEVSEYYVPVGHKVKECFGHLCYADVLRWLNQVRMKLLTDLDRSVNNEYINKYFDGLTYEDFKFRYFLCGEYGPTTFRPHYHLILWFDRYFTPEQGKYISQVLSSCWSLGRTVLEVCKDGGASGYVSEYVTSFNGLPEVLQRKHLRPFCTFSKSPTIGSNSYSSEKVKEALDRGFASFPKWDVNTKTFVDDVPPPEILRRHFPKCTGFGYRDRSEKLRVYSFVFYYFQSRGITHTVEDLANIQLKDIEFPVRLLSDKEVTEVSRDYYATGDASVLSTRLLYGRYLPNQLDDGNVSIKNVNPSLYEDWSYIDKYASLVAYRYWVTYGITPDSFLYSLDSIYANLRMISIKKLYMLQDEKKVAGLDISDTLIHDVSFLLSLPRYFDDLSPSQVMVLESYDVDVMDLYCNFDSDGVLCIDEDYFSPVFSRLDGLELYHHSKVKNKYEKKVKKKKMNEYKAGLKSNRRFNKSAKSKR